MSPEAKRSSPTLSTHHELKHRVNTCLTKLSDRDTLTIATNELESIVHSLNHDSFSPFLTCILTTTDSSEKPLVRKQCVKVLGLLTQVHGETLGCPHMSKMVGYIVRRLKDPDTLVRSACVDTVAVMAGKVSTVPLSVFLKPLMEAIVHEQDYNSQVGGTLCLIAVIEAAMVGDVDRGHVVKGLPKLVKLVRSESFRAKPALLSLIGIIVGSNSGGGMVGHNLLGNVVGCLMEFLSSEDWAARKAAAEAFGKLAIAKTGRMSEFKSSCMMTFETRRFDKVKVVRDTINQMMEAWKDVPDVTLEVIQPLHSKSSSRDNANDGRSSNGSRSINNIGSISYESPQVRSKTIPSKSPQTDSSSATSTARRQSPLKSAEMNLSQPFIHKSNCKKVNIESIQVLAPHKPPTYVHVDNVREQLLEKVGSNKQQPNTERRQKFTNKNSSANLRGPGGGSRVAPFPDESSGSTYVAIYRNELDANAKDNEELSLIRKQLGQIEIQQSSLLDLLQRFMGSSQNGIRSLETRVHGLEKALDEISYDLGVSTGRVLNNDSAGSMCCNLPGAEFLSPKFWRRPEDSHLKSMISSGFSINPLADICIESRINLNNHPDQAQSSVFREVEGRHARRGNRIDVASRMIFT